MVGARRLLGSSPRAARHNLPLHITSFIGREHEIAEVRRLVHIARLLTLTGVGGVGKSRLALQVASELTHAFTGGVWLVELAPLSDPGLIAHTVAAAMGAQEEPGQTMLESLVAFARPKSLLLVLDNCEHLVTASAQLADALVRACPLVRILATSREPLGIAGEVIHRVPALSLPNLSGRPPLDRLMRSEAVRLFVERASLVRPHFALIEDDARTVAQVCRRLDGIPWRSSSRRRGWKSCRSSRSPPGWMTPSSC